VCAAVCCSVVQCGAVCYSPKFKTHQKFHRCFRALVVGSVAVWRSVVQCVVVHNLRHTGILSVASGRWS